MTFAAFFIVGFAVVFMAFVAWCNYTPTKDKETIMQLGPEAPYKLEPPDNLGTSK